MQRVDWADFNKIALISLEAFGSGMSFDTDIAFEDFISLEVRLKILRWK